MNLITFTSVRNYTHALYLLTLALGLWVLSTSPGHATSPACTPNVPTINIASVAVFAGTPNGSTIGSPTTITATFNCSRASRSYPFTTVQVGQLATFDNAAPAPNGGIMFTTSIPGIEVNLTATPNQAGDGNNGAAGVPGWELGTVCPSGTYPAGPCSTTSTTLTATFTAQLVKVGPVTAGATSTAQLAQFTNYNFGYTDSAPYYGSLKLNGFTVTTPACIVAVDPTVVTLPTVSTSAFSGTGSTAGQTAFAIKLTCASPPHTTPSLSITLNTSSPQAGATGVIAPTAATGMAKRIGVQVVKANGTTPVTFGTAIAEGLTPNGAMSLPFFARYYQTAASPTAGKVTATATYTLTYP